MEKMLVMCIKLKVHCACTHYVANIKKNEKIVF